MSFITKLLGNSKDLQLMQLFLDLTAKSRSSVSYLETLLAQYDNEDQRQTCFYNIEKLENEGDEIVWRIVELISEISITSWVSHDMSLRLVHMLDEVLDNNQSVIRFMENYRISKVSNDMVSLGNVIDEGAGELEEMMKLFCQPGWPKNIKKILVHITKIRECEHQGDILKAQGLRSLLNSQQADKIATIRDIAEFRGSEKLLETLETITDNIHHLSTLVHQCLND